MAPTGYSTPPSHPLVLASFLTRGWYLLLLCIICATQLQCLVWTLSSGGRNLQWQHRECNVWCSVDFNVPHMMRHLILRGKVWIRRSFFLRAFLSILCSLPAQMVICQINLIPYKCLGDLSSLQSLSSGEYLNDNFTTLSTHACNQGSWFVEIYSWSWNRRRASLQGLRLLGYRSHRGDLALAEHVLKWTNHGGCAPILQGEHHAPGVVRFSACFSAW